ncbi:hypothetical protein D9758_004658 [Tetrapyrgos nigripes]|uniref:Reverse transcriptase domain-containing protein n=1 Tax=Tetrapyrgos nigripes TaxID=182062 RepID=A0A8H5GZQ7_9AGAR|nr:hypothetical protein D9758_004658 [Tetrapyrgos nigripes]
MLSWLVSWITVILKNGKDPSDTNGYCAVLLESCLLKMLTYIIHKSLYDWALNLNLIPPSQNRFHPEYCTNNTFILHTIIEKSLAEDKHVWLAFVDISNAFPSVTHSLLWLKLHNNSLTGKLFDWLQKLYTDMEYVIKSNIYSDISVDSNMVNGSILLVSRLWALRAINIGLVPYNCCCQDGLRCRGQQQAHHQNI